MILFSYLVNHILKGFILILVIQGTLEDIQGYSLLVQLLILIELLLIIVLLIVEYVIIRTITILVHLSSQLLLFILLLLTQQPHQTTQHLHFEVLTIPIYQITHRHHIQLNVVSSQEVLASLHQLINQARQLRLAAHHPTQEDTKQSTLQEILIYLPLRTLHRRLIYCLQHALIYPRSQHLNAQLHQQSPLRHVRFSSILVTVVQHLERHLEVQLLEFHLQEQHTPVDHVQVQQLE